VITTTWTLSRHSKEWVGPITVTADDVAVTGWTYLVVPFGEQPATPEAINKTPTVLDDVRGVLVGPATDNVLAAGRYLIWVRYVSGQEAPVLDDVGILVIT
jgi:hypothetical protein